MTRISCATKLVEMKNVTVTVDEDVALWARVYAARHGTSVSRLLGELLQERMLEEQGYEAAMQQYLSVAPRVLSASGRYPTRDEIHERGSARSHD